MQGNITLILGQILDGRKTNYIYNLSLISLYVNLPISYYMLHYLFLYKKIVFMHILRKTSD